MVHAVHAKGIRWYMRYMVKVLDGNMYGTLAANSDGTKADGDDEMINDTEFSSQKKFPRKRLPNKGYSVIAISGDSRPVCAVPRQRVPTPSPSPIHGLPVHLPAFLQSALGSYWIKSSRCCLDLEIGKS